MKILSISQPVFFILMSAAKLVQACSGSLHIEIEQTGVYALDYAAIVAQQPGLAGCVSDSLVLTQQGQEIPIRIANNGEHIFSAGHRIEWIGHQLHGPLSWFNTYSNNNVYLLSAAPGTHARIRDAAESVEVRHQFFRSVHLEQENLMIRLDQEQANPGEEPDVWQWAKLTQVDPQPALINFDLLDFAATDTGVALTLNFRGLSNAPTPPLKQDKPIDHQVDVHINGHSLTSLTWDGRDEIKKQLVVPAALLKAQGNTLALRVPKRTIPGDDNNNIVDVVMFNWLEARYSIAGNLNASAQPFSLATSDSANSFVLDWKGDSTPIVYGDDGQRRIGVPNSLKFWRFAGAAAHVTLYPVLDEAFLSPVLVRAIASTDWRNPQQGFDYLIVSHPTLIDAIRPLAAFHKNQGHNVAIIDVNEVYDQFNGGIIHPQAIRNLVEHAYHHWPSPQLRFLLLVGDASFDIRHQQLDERYYAKWAKNELLIPGQFGSIPATPYSNTPQTLPHRNLIPTWQFPSSEGQSASDNWFAAINADDYHPVIAVGRFPVVEPDEVKDIVNKTITYASSPQIDSWRREVMFITDESDSFKQASDEIANTLGDIGFAADKVYASRAEKDNLAHKADIKNGIDEGRLLIHFIGHGGRFIWRTGPPDLRKNHDLFTLDDVSTLTNQERLPMVLSMTCYSAPFDNPTEDSIGERFLREPDKGAIAVFAASWRNYPSPSFSKSIIDELLKPGATIGEAIVRGKKSATDRTLVETYNLLGDPAVILERPHAALKLAVNEDVWQQGLLVELPWPSFQGHIKVDWLDEHNKLLLSVGYQNSEPRFYLKTPALPKARIAKARVYALNSHNNHDAIGAVDMRQTVKAKRDWSGWLRKSYQRKPTTADTLIQADFENTEIPHSEITPKANH